MQVQHWVPLHQNERRFQLCSDLVGTLVAEAQKGTKELPTILPFSVVPSGRQMAHNSTNFLHKKQAAQTLFCYKLVEQCRLFTGLLCKHNNSTTQQHALYRTIYLHVHRYIRTLTAEDNILIRSSLCMYMDSLYVCMYVWGESATIQPFEPPYLSNSKVQVHVIILNYFRPQKRVFYTIPICTATSSNQ